MIDKEFEQEAQRFLDELKQDLDAIEGYILKLASGKDVKANLLRFLRVLHSLKGSSGSYGFDIASSLIHRMEDLLIIHEFEPSVSTELIDKLLLFKDDLSQAIQAYGNNDLVQLNTLKIRYQIGDSANHASSKAIPEKVSRVLVLESSKAIISAITSEGTNLDIEFAITKDGYEALGRLLKEKFDLLIVSGQASSIDGFHLLQILDLVPNINKSIKNVMISSSKETSTPAQVSDLILLNKGPLLRKQIRDLFESIAVASAKDELQFNSDIHILVVDDSPEIHKLIEISFKKWQKVKLQFISSSLEVPGYLKQNTPDILLLDVQMPSQSGDELFKHLQETKLLKTTKVVFLTGLDTSRELNRLRQLQPAGVLKKPFSPKSLALEIFRLIQ